MATGGQGLSWSGGPSQGQRDPKQKNEQGGAAYWKKIQADLNKRFGKNGMKKIKPNAKVIT